MNGCDNCSVKKNCKELFKDAPSAGRFCNRWRNQEGQTREQESMEYSKNNNKNK